jgi:hypothetical protein
MLKVRSKEIFLFLLQKVLLVGWAHHSWLFLLFRHVSYVKCKPNHNTSELIGSYIGQLYMVFSIHQIQYLPYQEVQFPPT